MNFNVLADAGMSCIAKAAQKADDCLGKALVKTGNAIVDSPKITSELATELYGAGVDVSKKNTRRLVEAALKNRALQKIDNGINMAFRMANADPVPGVGDFIETAVDVVNNSGIKNNIGFAKASDNARNILSFRHENLSIEAQNVISNYLKSPANVAKLFCN